MELKLVNFIRKNSNWEEILKRKPYNVIIKRFNGYVIFNYTLGGSDFSYDYDILRECRGTILDEMNNYEPVCVPFFKFFNYGEPYADKIDWTTAHVYQKIDGSLIKFWLGRDKELYVSTNGMIDSRETSLIGADGETYSFYDLVVQAIGLEGLDLIKEYLIKNKDKHTIMCELISPHNRIVVDYKTTELFLLSIRNKEGNEELELLDSNILTFLKRPKRVSALNLQDVIALCQEIDPLKEEGFVAVDANFKRVKVKSEEYVRLHHNLTMNKISTKNLINLIKQGEIEEVLNYNSSLAERYEKIKTIFYNYKEYINKIYLDTIFLKKPNNAKEFAQAIKERSSIEKNLLFKINKEKRILDAEDLLALSIQSLCDIVKEFS